MSSFAHACVASKLHSRCHHLDVVRGQASGCQENSLTRTHVLSHGYLPWQELRQTADHIPHGKLIFVAAGRGGG